MYSADSVMFGESGSKNPADYIAAAVEDAKRTIETAVLPTNPRDPSNGVLPWRIRPSEMRALAVQDYLEPPPEWGLKINLANMYIGPDHAKAVAHSLILNHSVTTLDLSCCDMGTDAAIELMHCLERNKTLKHLNITGNLIGPEGGVRAASSLVGKLETLHIACNEIGDVGGDAIATALRESTTMKFLNVRGNHIRLFTLYRMVEALDPTLLSRLSDELKAELAVSRQLIRDDEAKEKARKAQAAKEAAQAAAASVLASGASSPVATAGVFGAERSSAFDLGGTTPNLTRRPSTISLNSAAQMNERGDDASTVGSAKKGRVKPGSSEDGGNTPAAQSVERPPSPLVAPPAGTPSCTVCSALWVHGNLDPFPKELLDNLNKILTLRVPQPPEGLNSKKKKGRKGK